MAADAAMEVNPREGPSPQSTSESSSMPEAGLLGLRATREPAWGLRGEGGEARWEAGDARAAAGSSQGDSPAFAVGATLRVLESIEADAEAAARVVQGMMREMSAYMAQVSCNTAEHVELERDAAGLLQAHALEAASKGNKLVNSYLRLHEELRDLPHLCLQVHALRQRVDAVDALLRQQPH